MQTAGVVQDALLASTSEGRTQRKSKKSRSRRRKDRDLRDSDDDRSKSSSSLTDLSRERSKSNDGLTDTPTQGVSSPFNDEALQFRLGFPFAGSRGRRTRLALSRSVRRGLATRVREDFALLEDALGRLSLSGGLSASPTLGASTYLGGGVNVHFSPQMRVAQQLMGNFSSPTPQGPPFEHSRLPRSSLSPAARASQQQQLQLQFPGRISGSDAGSSSNRTTRRTRPYINNARDAELLQNYSIGLPHKGGICPVGTLAARPFCAESSQTSNQSAESFFAHARVVAASAAECLEHARIVGKPSSRRGKKKKKDRDQHEGASSRPRYSPAVPLLEYCEPPRCRMSSNRNLQNLGAANNDSEQTAGNAAGPRCQSSTSRSPTRTGARRTFLLGRPSLAPRTFRL